MRIICHVLLAFFSIFSYPLAAQCPPPGFPQPGNTCPTAPILCENLDGYCATINNNNTQQPFPGCNAPYVLNNDEWFAFFAGSTTITIQVTPSNCSQGPNMGLQGGIYGACMSQVMDVQCQCTEDPFILTSNNYVIGQIYWFVLDGCSGNVCDYAIDVIAGSTVGVPPANPGNITGLTSVCQNSTTGYSLPPVVGATIYNWTLTPNIGTISGTGPNINVTWGNNTTSTQLCVTTANACYANNTPSCITIDVIPTPTATISGSGILCQGVNGTVNLTVTFTGEGPWTFVPTRNGVAQPPITTSSNPYTYQATQPGTYGLQSVNVPGGNNNCPGTVSGSATVTQINITATSVVTAPQCGLSNGAVNLSVSGGTAPYAFVWSNGPTTEDLSSIPAGSYSVTVTDANGCTRVHTVSVTDNNINVIVSGNTTANTTCIDGNGAIDVSVNPPPGSYTYLWSNGATTQDIGNLTPGSYTITVTAGVTCTGTATFTVANNPNEPAVTATTVQSTCDLSNGSINASVSGGVAPYTFIWSDGSTTEDLSNIAAGSYTVTVTGANGCTKVATFTVSNNNPAININANIASNTTCIGGNGSINISVAPANPNYTFIWSTGATTEDISNLTAGSYTVTVSAGGSCTQTATYNISDNPNNPNVTATAVQSTCELSNGSINVSVSGGVAPYTFIWSTGATTEDLANVPAGSYSVTVTGANGCTNLANVNVGNNNPPININGNVVANTTCSGGNGSITLSVTPANPNYTYIWSNGATTPNLNSLPPGSYSVTVSAGGACTQTASFTVPDNPNVPNLSITTVSTTCDQSNGSINLTVSGGVPPYTYLWSSGQTTQDIGNIPAGFYTVTVTGANGCSSSAGTNVDNNNPVINVNATIVANTLCNGSGNGSINLIITPSGSYTYLWSTGATTPNLTNLVQGTFTVTVTASGSCSQVASFTIPDNPNGPTITGVETGTTCDLANGNINISVSGATAPYSYIWSGGQTTQDINNIPAGSYTVTVSGANGCTNIANFSIDNNNPPITVTATTVANTACSFGNGSINVSVSPPAGPYTYLWSSGQTTQDISGVQGGTYTVTVYGAGSCSQTASFDVDDNPSLPSLILDYTPSTCGKSNGKIDLMVSGGAAPYSYLWSSGQTTQDLNNVPPDLYFVTVTGANGCTSVEGGDLPDDVVVITISGVVLPDNSCATNNGKITLTLDPPQPAVTILWSTGSTASVLNNLAAGTYSVTVSAGGTCTKTATFVVPDESQSPNLTNAVTPANCGVSNGAIDLTVTGGLAPITYTWSNNATTQDLSSLPPGNYSVTVNTAGGCSAISAITVPSNDVAISISGNVVDNTSCNAPNGSVALTVTPAGNPYTYAWSNSANTANIGNLAPGNYSVTVTTGVTCSAVAGFIVADNATAPNLAATATPSTCGLPNGGADANPGGGVSPYTFLWSNSGNTEQISNLAQGAYSVTVTGANGCSSAATVNVVNNNLALNISGIIIENTSCTTGNGGVNLSVTPPGNYNYNWSNSTTLEDVTDLEGGTYTVTVSAGGSCSSTATFNVTNNTQNPAITPAVTAAICGNDNGAIDLTVSGAIAPYTFVWSNNATSEDLANIFSGNYSVTVSAANGCSSDTTLNVANNSSTFSLSGAATPLTNCVTPNGAVDLVITPPGNFTVQWSNNATTEDLSGLPQGTYTVSVTDPAGTGCTATASFIVDDNTTFPTSSQTVAPEICGLQNGSIDIAVSGGVLPYAYQWSNNTNNEDLSAAAAGTYTVTITGANACATTASATIPANSISFALAGATAPNTVCGTSNGSIDLSVTPAGTYTFVWSTNATTEDVNGLLGGNYAVTVSAGGNCTGEASFTVGDNTLSPAIAEIVTPAFCAKSNGGIDLSVSGGAAPYNYLWSNNLTNEDLNNIAAGNYAVTVTGANGCSSVNAFVVPDNVIAPGLSGVVTPNTSCAAGNGAVALAVTPPDTYTFTWSNNASTQNLTAIAPGDYSVTVSSGGDCTAIASFVVPDNTDAVLLSGAPTDILCFGDLTGAVDVSVSGGVLPYQFNWSPAIPGNPEDPANLTAGNYTLTVTDAAGCKATATYTVGQPASAVQIACSATTTVSSPGQTDGAGQVDVSGGTAPYIIDWSPGGTSAIAPPGIFVLDNLGIGTYSVTVTDANSCPAVCDFTVSLINCNTAVGTMSNTPLSLCGPGCLTAFYNPAGQFLDPNDVLQFVLHEGNGSQIVNEIARNTQAKFCFDPALMTYGATYYVSAVAGNNDGTGNVNLNDFCAVISAGTPISFRQKPEVAVAPPGTLSCAVQQVPLAGSVNLPGSTFQWTTSGGSIAGNPAQAVINVDAAGLYTLIVNHNGCADTAAVTVNDITNQPKAEILASPGDLLDCTIDEIILSGTIEGTNAPNSVWILNGAYYSGGNPVPIDAPGLYEFIVLDTLTFCADTATIAIDQNLAYPPLFLNPPGLLTCTNKTVTLSGGSPFPGIQFAWAIVTGADTTVVGNGATLLVTTPGTYLLIGSDPANSCTNAITTTVNADVTAPTAEAGAPFSIACYGETGQLDGSGSSGAANLAFQWTSSDGSFVGGSNIPKPTIDEPGTYVLLVTIPANGCTDTDAVVIAPKAPIAELNVKQPACYGEKGAIIVEKVNGGKPPMRYSIDNGATYTTGNVFYNLTPGAYTVLAIDAEGCSATVGATIVEGELLEITVEPKVTIKLGDSYQINTQISVPLSALADITWTPATGLSCDTCLNPVATPFTSTQYHIDVKSLAGCKDRAPLLLLVDKSVDIYVPNIFSPDGDGENDVFMIFADNKNVKNIKSFQVFSRWGELVSEHYNFLPNDPAYSWDGRHRGQELNPAVFVWYAVIVFIDGSEVLYEGDVTLKR